MWGRCNEVGGKGFRFLVRIVKDDGITKPSLGLKERYDTRVDVFICKPYHTKVRIRASVKMSVVLVVERRASHTFGACY